MISARFYTDFAADPWFNMAFDEWLFARALDHPGMVALRLYSWRPGAITFGFNQKLEKAIDHERLNDTPLIRRVTGGRALYHDPSELTYAVIVNAGGLQGSVFRGSVRQSSAAISEALTAFLKYVGVDSQYLRHTRQSDHSRSYFHTAPCFDSVARHEVVSTSGKVVASAQRRIGEVLLQHGAIKFNGVAYHAALDGATCPEDRRERLEPVISQRFSELAGVFCSEVGNSLGLVCERARLNEQEAQGVRARRLEVEKNSVARRDIIKQRRVDKSLLVERRRSRGEKIA